MSATPSPAITACFIVSLLPISIPTAGAMPAFLSKLWVSACPRIVGAGFFRAGLGPHGGRDAGGLGEIHVWHVPALVAIFDDDAVFQFAGGTLGHPRGHAAATRSPELAAAMETWKEIKFEFDTVDELDMATA
jgi:hypothetical protein